MGRHRRVVVIIGASRGIGRATAHEFARRGTALVLVARDGQALAGTARRCREAGADVLELVGDITTAGFLADVVNEAVARFGRIDVWAGVAGVVAYGFVERTPLDVYRRVLDINLLAQIDGVQQALPVFRRQGSGRIVLVGSLYSRVTAPAMSPYVASKFALLAFARSLRQELVGSGIDVRIVLPATIDTPIYQRAANFTGKTPHAMPPATSAHRVARAITRAARGRGSRIRYVGRLQSSMVLLSALLPNVYDRVIRVLIRTLALRRPAQDTLGGLETLPPDDGSVGGGWRSPALRAVVATTAVGAASLVAGRRRRR